MRPIQNNNNNSNVQIKQINHNINRNIIMIGIGKEYVSNINWDVLTYTLQAMNPNYKIMIFLDDDIKSFLINYYPQYIMLYHSLHYVQWKSDLLRYLLLYEYGGVYIDIDLKPVLSFDSIISYVQGGYDYDIKHIFVRGGNEDYEMCNGFIITKPKQLIFLKLVEYMLEDSNPTFPYAGVYLVNVRRFHSTVKDLYSVTPEDFLLHNEEIYFMKEFCLIKHNHYVMKLNDTVLALYSNGHLNWSPKNTLEIIPYV